jgi:hypothetical protein
MPKLTPDQIAALKSYARAHGLKWRSELIADWYAGNTSGQLQGLHEAYGVSWILRYKLPGFTAASARWQQRRAS